MRPDRSKPPLRCAVYTRVSTEHGLEQEFNSLDNQREASEAYVKSQAHEGWKLIRTHYDDGGYSGGSMDRPALKRLLDDVRAHRIDVVVVYKVDRLTRSLADFAKLVELFDAHQVSFVSVTQAFNTTTSMGRLTLNVLLSFAQFEREVTGERIRDKIAASKRKGIWMGGVVPLGYRVENRALHVVEEHAAFIRDLYRRYLEIGSVVRLKALLDQEDARLPLRTDRAAKTIGGAAALDSANVYAPIGLASVEVQVALSFLTDDRIARLAAAEDALTTALSIASGTQNSASETHFRVHRPRPVVPAE
jgi:site-specific DNA recombinase